MSYNEYRREYMREYLRMRNASKQTKMTLACRRFLKSKGIDNMDMSQEEIKKLVEEYKTAYELKYKKKSEIEALLEANRRHAFIYERTFYSE